jgi:hypothetical protein
VEDRRGCRYLVITVICSMDGERTEKRSLAARPGGGRNKARPGRIWLYDVELDLRNMGVERWRSRCGQNGLGI